MSHPFLFAVLATAVLALPVAAQDPVCRDEESLGACLNRTISVRETGLGGAVQSARNAASDAVTEQQEELQREVAGPNLTELAQSAIRDFLPRFAGDVLTTNPSGELPALNLRFNAPLRWDRPRSNRLVVQGALTLHPAEPFAGLVDLVPDDRRDAVRERLVKELEDGDDATLTGSLNVENRRFGRVIAPHQDLIDSLTNELVRRFDPGFGASPAEQALSEFEVRLGVDSTNELYRGGSDCRLIQRGALAIPCLTPKGRVEYEGLVMNLARYVLHRRERMDAAIGATGFTRLSELVNNQPQLNVTVEYRSRLAVVGPNEWTGRARWERGGTNMNALRRACRYQRLTIGCFEEFVNHPDVRRSLARGGRHWLETVVRHRPRYRVSLAEDSVTFSARSATGVGVSGGYGAYVGSLTDGGDRDRVDIHASFDHARGDGLRHDRWLVGAFYTLRISGSASGVVGVAWANRPEYVGGADRRLHANIGLSYKINRGTPAAPGAGTDP